MPLSYESRALSGTRSTGTAWVRGALQQLIGDIPDFRRDLRTPDEVSADEAFPIINRLTQAFRKEVDPKTQRSVDNVRMPGRSWHPLANTTLFGVLLCRPTAPGLPIWGTGTSVRRRFSGSSRTSRCLPVSKYLGCRNVKHNGGSRH